MTYSAVQCYQCHHFQVQQRTLKKRQWKCVICGEKQSFRKIYADSEKAKDVRPVVMDLNRRKGEMEESNGGFADAFGLNTSNPGNETDVPNNALEHSSRNLYSERCESKWGDYVDEEESVQHVDSEPEEKDNSDIITDMNVFDQLRKRRQQNPSSFGAKRSKPTFANSQRQKVQYRAEDPEDEESLSISMTTTSTSAPALARNPAMYSRPHRSEAQEQVPSTLVSTMTNARSSASAPSRNPYSASPRTSKWSSFVEGDRSDVVNNDDDSASDSDAYGGMCTFTENPTRKHAGAAVSIVEPDDYATSIGISEEVLEEYL